jgi:hypothetical protein
MNKEQQELLDEAHNNYLNKCLDKKWMKKNVFFDGSSNHHLYLQQEFINKCKTDTEFSERWGLKIDERELSLLERYELMKKLDNWVSVHYKEPKTMEYMDKHNIPTKLITVTYKNKTIESYE